jgi:tRNA A37 methylthiotransferase MiaB
LSRGKIKSKRIDDIMTEFERGLEKGYQQFVLLGTDIGDYGKDINLDLHSLLEKLVSYKANFRLRLRNINPRWIIPNRTALEILLRSEKIVYIQSPIQSANNRILELMNRGYQSQKIISIMQDIHQKFPFVVLKTQIIVGFPTETKEEFEETLDLVNKKIFDYVDVFRFTPREKTFAATIEPQVPFNEIVRRYRKVFLRSLFSQPSRKFAAIRRLQRVI